MTKLSEWKADWKNGLEQAWQSVAEGWRELSERASGALTRFRPGADPASAASEPPTFAGWSLLAADVFDDDDKVIVRLEAPGMRKDDFDIELRDDMLVVRGEKRFERESGSGSYRVVQCAYGTFRRAVPLPTAVRADKANASYRDGVLRIELPKVEGLRVRRVPVHSA